MGEVFVSNGEGESAEMEIRRWLRLRVTQLVDASSWKKKWLTMENNIIDK